MVKHTQHTSSAMDIEFTVIIIIATGSDRKSAHTIEAWVAIEIFSGEKKTILSEFHEFVSAYRFLNM